uniref:Tudor domain-containing protein n=1 Tax=Panagrellus redivivus TaxID=6233 RepID=A0A7E4VY34_PANRE
MSYLVDDFKENDPIYGSQDSIESKNANCLRTINSTKMPEYLEARDETNTRRYPAVSVAKCPKSLNMESLPELYNIAYSSMKETPAYSEGRIYFACPASRAKFLKDWEEKYSKTFPEVQVSALENFNQSSWTLPIKRFTFPDKSPYPLFHQINSCFADVPYGDIKNFEITPVTKDSWLFTHGGPHFFVFVDKAKRDSIEAALLDDNTPPTVERPCMGSCVTVKTENYKAARGVIYSRRLNFANIFLVDYGISAEFPDSSLTSVNRALMELPFLAVPCKLALREKVEIEKLPDFFTQIKADSEAELRKMGYRGSFNMIDAFKNGKSILNEALGLSKPTRQIPARVYDRQQVYDLKSTARSKYFMSPLDNLTTTEWNNLFIQAKGQKAK